MVLQIGTIFEANVDLRTERIKIVIKYTQIKMITQRDQMKVLAWLIPAVILSVISAVLAIPAAAQVHKATHHAALIFL